MKTDKLWLVAIHCGSTAIAGSLLTLLGIGLIFPQTQLDLIDVNSVIGSGLMLIIIGLTATTTIFFFKPTHKKELE